MERYALGTAVGAAVIGLFALGLAIRGAPEAEERSTAARRDVTGLERRLQETEKAVDELRRLAEEAKELRSQVKELEGRARLLAGIRATKLASSLAGAVERIAELETALERLEAELSQMRRAAAGPDKSPPASPASSTPVTGAPVATAPVSGTTESPEPGVRLSAAEEHIRRMAQGLGLEGVRAGKFVAIKLEERRAIRRIYAAARDNLLDRQAAWAQILQVRAEALAGIRELLSDEQLGRYLKMEASSRRR